MIYLESPSVDPAFNLALEQFVFDDMDRSQEYFMLWQNDNAVIVGKNQNTAEEIDSNYVREHSIRVVRRLSGGGAVYHDLGNLNFTFITAAGNASQMDLHAFNRPILKVLSRLGAEAFCNGRNDMTIAGCKFSGSSQYPGRTDSAPWDASVRLGFVRAVPLLTCAGGQTFVQGNPVSEKPRDQYSPASEGRFNTFPVLGTALAAS